MKTLILILSVLLATPAPAETLNTEGSVVREDHYKRVGSPRNTTLVLASSTYFLVTRGERFMMADPEREIHSVTPSKLIEPYTNRKVIARGQVYRCGDYEKLLRMDCPPIFLLEAAQKVEEASLHGKVNRSRNWFWSRTVLTTLSTEGRTIPLIDGRDADLFRGTKHKTCSVTGGFDEENRYRVDSIQCESP